MANKYFNWYNKNQEWDLYNCLADESIEQYGIQCIYLPKHARKDDRLFGETQGTYFDSEYSFEITMYLEDPMSFTEDEMYSKFGLSVNNRVTLFVQQDRLIKEIGDEPFFGDLIYVPMFNRLFEVSNPEEKTSFFLFGRLMTYALKCELYKYSQATMNTGIEEVDNLEGETAQKPELNDNMEDQHDEVQDYINFDEKNPFG